METKALCPAAPPLSEEELEVWNHLVEVGRELRAPKLERRAAERAEQVERLRRLAEAKGRKFEDWRKRPSTGDSMREVPDGAKRWVVLRYSGIPFRKAGEASGSSWAEVSMCLSRSEDFRCAYAAQEESSRRLMLAKAQSTVEASQDEDSGVSVPQANIAVRILGALDRDHFGEDRGRGAAPAEEAASASAGGGGFVINLIADAAKVAEAVPAKRTGRALVYSDV